MRNFFMLLLVALTILNFFVYTNSPDRVAGQFGPGGRPTSWMSRETQFFLMQGLELFLFLLFTFIPELIVRTPVQWVNMPHREFWLAPENRSATKAKLAVLMAEMGVYLFLFFGALTLILSAANRSETVRLHMSDFWMTLAAFLGSTAFWSIKFYRTFRKPEHPEFGHPPAL